MGKKQAVTRITTRDLITRPDYMPDDAPKGTDQMQEYITPPRLKVVQKQAGAALLELFGVGDIILVPEQVLVSEMARDPRGQPTGAIDPVPFTPLFFFAEWCTWNPIEMRGEAPAIRARSFDPHGEIAQKAQSPQLRYEAHPENPKLQIRHVEHLNFIVGLHDVRFSDQPVVLSFQRAGHALGRRFCSLVRLRKAPLYGCNFALIAVKQENQYGDWWTLDASNPPEGVSPWVAENVFVEYRKLHEDLAKGYDEARIPTNYDEDPPSSGADDL